MNRSSLSLSLVALSIAFAGCHPYKVVSQASPNPMVGAKSFSVEQVSFGNGVGTAEDMGKLSSCFTQTVTDDGGDVGAKPAAGGTFIVRPTVTSLDSSNIIARNTVSADMVVRIVDAQGKTIDEFTTSGSNTQKGLEQVVKAAPACQVGEKLAKNMLRYISERTEK